MQLPGAMQYVLLLALALFFESCTNQPGEIERIRPLYQSKSKPQPGDWLADHQETYYDFDSYKYLKPVRPTKDRSIIYLYRLGVTGKSADSLLQVTREYLRLIFHLEVKFADSLSLSIVPDSLRREWSDGSIQLRTGPVLKKMMVVMPENAAVAICFTGFDVFPGPGWNFVFGEAYLKQRVGIWSYNRYGNVNDKKEFQRVLMRTLKVASHETGHMFGITHCVRYECNMNGSNSLQ